MKRILCLLSLLVCMSISVWAEQKVAPYYSLSLDGAVFVPNKGDWMASVNFTNDIGVIYQPAAGHQIIGFYELRYVGPALQRYQGSSSKEVLTDHTLSVSDPEMVRFTDRTQDHLGLLRYHYKINDMLTLKTQLDYMTEYKRTGANEVWGEGLYDFNRTGGGVTLSAKLLDDLIVDLSFASQSLDFPNYTDLLGEIQLSSGSTESATGMQNQKVVRTGLSVRYLGTSLSADITSMNYDKQKVITETAQADGSFYSSTLQKDSVVSFNLCQNIALFNHVFLSPNATLKLKNSNQNYQFFATATSTVPVQYFDDYYTYQELTFSVPFSLLIMQNCEMFYNAQWSVKTYKNRPPQDNAGNFLTGQLENNLAVFSGGFTFKTNAVTRVTIFYTYQNQISNMKYERYVPYNYDGYCAGIGFNFTY